MGLQTFLFQFCEFSVPSEENYCVNNVWDTANEATKAADVAYT